jgi:tRNA modification GTPase
MPARDCAYVVLLTPEGRGAVATLLVAGPRATELVDDLFCSAAGRRLEEFPPGRIVYGRFRDADGEELIVCRRAEDEVEVHCHGGAAATARWIDALVERGAQRVDWREWLDRRQIAGRCGDPLTVSAAIALAEARTRRAASILLDQFNGALRREIDAVATALAAHDISNVQQRLRTLAGRAHLGLHLTRSFQVVLAGRPNVGKSSLINALVGYQRAIVFDQPGTTRDVVTALTAIDGWPVELSDTAGIRASSEPLEIEGVQRARARVASADAIALVFDASRAWTADDAALLADYPAALVVHNKCDLLAAARDSRPAGILTSAVTGEGFDRLLADLANRLAPAAPPLGAPVPFTREQFLEIETALDAIGRGDCRGAAVVLADFGRGRSP